MCVGKKKKKAITLLEIMIVIFLIGLIGSVIGYNVKGSLEEGKAFRSEQGIERLHDILLMEAASGISISEIIEAPGFYVKKSGLSSNPAKLLKDGWGQPYKLTAKGDYDIAIHSEAYDKYKTKKRTKRAGSKEDPVVEDEEVLND